LLGPALVAIGVAVATHVAALQAIPGAVMREVLRVAAAQAGGVNRVSYAARVTDETQIVVRASTDFFYATCVYDLSTGPVAIAVPTVPETQSVLALFSANMDNFYVAGDWQGQPLRVVVAPAGERPSTDLPVVNSPSPRGLLLVRVIVHDERTAGAIDATRRAVTCAPLRAQRAAVAPTFG
jgi:hypothetical protein